VANEAERSDVGFEIPDHYSAVGGAADDLFEVGVEAAGEDALLVALKRSFERGVCEARPTGRSVNYLVFRAVRADRLN